MCALDMAYHAALDEMKLFGWKDYEYLVFLSGHLVSIYLIIYPPNNTQSLSNKMMCLQVSETKI